jgi:hypothetical protein
MMHLFIAFDGSDDGFEALQTLLAHLDPAEQRRVSATVIMWPQRESPIWDKAFAHEVEVDDLHRAMAEVADIEITRVRRLFGEETLFRAIAADGEPVDVLVNLTRADPPGLMLAAVTGGRHRDVVQAVLDQMVERTRQPVIIARGAGG